MKKGGARLMPGILFLLLLFTGKVTAVELSDSSRITILTCSPGQDLYSSFGHTGIRVTDYRQGFDVVFNYGTFDFGQEGFYVNFVRGKMRYMLAVDNFDDFMSQYVYEQRSVTEQVLRLGAEDRKKVFSFLFVNSQPENREYYYDFFWDNCATRPRDVFEKTLGQRLQFNPQGCGFEEGKTLHDMLRLYVHDYAWVDFGFDLGLGMPCEIIATPRDQTFLPDYLAKYFSCATLDAQPLVSSTATLLQYPLVIQQPLIKPIHITLALLLLGLGLTLLEYKKKRVFRWFDFSLFLIVGLVGVLLLSLWLFTEHYSVPRNLNMLWAIPVHLFIAPFLLKKRQPAWYRFYFLCTSVAMLILLAAWKWSPQPLNMAFIPVVILLATRSYLLFARLKKGNT